MDLYNLKLDSYLLPLISNIQKPNILELGVENGRSTLKFLEICHKNDGYLFSIDIDDCSKVSNDPKWNFIQARDDDFDHIFSKIPKKFDVIYLDTLHEASHVEKIFYKYYDLLKDGGFFFIDDISHLPYLNNKERNNFYCEINNQETFNKIIEIYNSNSELFNLNFSFMSSGIAIIQKKSIKSLKISNKIQSRKKTIKNLVRLIIRNIKT